MPNTQKTTTKPAAKPAVKAKTKAAKPAATDVQRAERRALNTVGNAERVLTAGRTSYRVTSPRDDHYLICYAAVADKRGIAKLSDLASRFPNGNPYHPGHPSATDGGALVRCIKAGNASHNGGTIRLSADAYKRGLRLGKTAVKI